MNIVEAMQMTKDFEGYSPQLYKCPAGYLTIGWGRNIEQRGISKDEAELMFLNDYKNAQKDLLIIFQEKGIDPTKVHNDVIMALTDMSFNLGYNRLSKFNRLFSELKNGSYEGVIREMKDSAWYKQVGKRSEKLVEIIKNVSKSS